MKEKKSKKQFLTTILSEIEQDARSTTVKNLRMIMLKWDGSDIHKVHPSEMETLPYLQLAKDEEWRTEKIKHLLEEKKTASPNIQ